MFKETCSTGFLSWTFFFFKMAEVNGPKEKIFERVVNYR